MNGLDRVDDQAHSFLSPHELGILREATVLALGLPFS